jgi:15-cis-phytoene synthase
MHDAFTYCAGLVRTADRDRYLAALFAPAKDRDALFALYAFNIEIARVREVAREAIAGEIRLQWWRDVLGGERDGEAAANPVAAALLATIKRYSLAADRLVALIDARRFDLYDDTFANMAALEAYLVNTSSAVIACAAQILGVDAPGVAKPAGLASGLVGPMRAVPLHAARHQLYVPLDILERHGVRPDEVFAGQSSAGLNGALAELRDFARRSLADTHALIRRLPSEALPAFLTVALVRPSLDRLDHRDAFAPGELSPWRRQWLIWRAARNPARIAG